MIIAERTTRVNTAERGDPLVMDMLGATDGLWVGGRALPSGGQYSASGFWMNGNPNSDAGRDLAFHTYIDTESEPVVPAPSALLLGSLGTGLIGWLRRRRSL
jgi:hypothetical protein